MNTSRWARDFAFHGDRQPRPKPEGPFESLEEARDSKNHQGMYDIRPRE